MTIETKLSRLYEIGGGRYEITATGEYFQVRNRETREGIYSDYTTAKKWMLKSIRKEGKK